MITAFKKQVIMLNLNSGTSDSNNLEELLHVLLNDIPDLIIFKDGEGRWITASKFAESLFGLENLQYIGKTSQELSQLSPIRQYRDILLFRQEADEKVWNAKKMIRSEVEFPLLNGRSVVLDVIATPVFNSDGSRKALVVIGRDITEQKIAEKKNFQLAYYDPLTQLPNRFMFEKELEKRINTAQSLSQSFVVMSLDIDRYKYIYDSLGPAAANQMLIHIAQRLKECVQKNWVLAYMGEDQFSVLIPDANAGDAAHVAQKLIDSMNKAFVVSELELFVTVSIGICSFPQHGEDVQSLVKHLDIALNLAKEKGRNRYQIYGSDMDVATFKAFALENDLKKALTMDQFEVYYQPKIDVDSHRIIGGEALLRWNHPEWGLISPREFISIAEETQLMDPIGEWVKETVCKHIRQWLDAGIEAVPISVNVSAKRFLKKSFLSNVKRVLQESGLDPSMLEIEITESTLIENEERAAEVINELRNIGVKVSLDDFGTGYSALSYLTHFKVDAIKIDRSFVKALSENSQNELVMKGVIQLVQSLNIHVIAEGVETAEQLRFLRRLNCKTVQGYVFSRPVKAEEFADMLKKGYIDAGLLQCGPIRPFINRRKHYRIHFIHPLLAEMTIIKLKGRDITLGKTEVLIEDMGPGGISFTTNVKLAVRPDMVLSVETVILGQNLRLVGSIVWCEEKDTDLYQYGMEFLDEEGQRESIAKVFFASLVSDAHLSDDRLIVKDARRFFKS
jgi:diguanylate cyclase (GGDEF)-like protein/PAS domain S-box-containing protein